VNNSVLQIYQSNFNNIYDNAVKPVVLTWGEFADVLIAGHPIVNLDKEWLPSFNAWRYKDIDDPNIDHGNKDGKPLDCFSKIHVRRLGSNLVEMSMLVIDFDGAMPIDDFRTRFGEYEYVCYTSLNHRVDGKDKFRALLPFMNPMPVADFRSLELAMKRFVDGPGTDVADKRTYVVNQVFLLPAVHEENAAHALAWRNAGVLLDWSIFDLSDVPAVATMERVVQKQGNLPREYRLLPNDVLETESGFISVKHIDRKISKVRCPFHYDSNPSEFVAVSKRGLPYLVCHKCGTIYMERLDGDPIVSGLARIEERKRQKAPRKAS
jgi:hypothetical protein